MSALPLAGRVVLRGAADHPHAARRLRAGWPQLRWLDGDAPGAPADGDLPTIALRADGALAEGAFALEVDRGSSSGAPRIELRGGPRSGVVNAAGELLARGGADAAPPLGAIASAPALPYRTLWTWDHSTNWELSQIGHQETGVFNPYGKPPEGFLADYRRLVDFASEQRIAAVVIYGFLRDAHGGVESARELCDYGEERGVRIVPGIAIGAYGGVYWEGEHRYNLATFLRANPELASDLERGVGFQIADLDFPLSFPRSDYTRAACPSQPRTLEWMGEAVAWLASTFAIGGVNVESGDYGVCGCDRCVARRGERDDAARRSGEGGESWSHADMADAFPAIAAAAAGARDDLWIYSELQWDNMLDPSAHALGQAGRAGAQQPGGAGRAGAQQLGGAGRAAASARPAGAIYQHTLNRSYWRMLRERLTADDVAALPTAPNVLRAQFACQWNGDRRTERYALNAPDFVELAGFAHRVGLRGLTIWGEVSPFHVTAELGYRAFARAAWDGDLTWERFLDEEAAPLLGDRAHADAFVAIAGELDRSPRLEPARLASLRGACDAAARGLAGEPERRWRWLEHRIAQRAYMGR